MQRTMLLLTAAMCTAAAATPAQQQPPERPPFRAGVEAVTLDVAVVDGDGKPIADLGPDDFTVTVAGQPRRVVSVTFIAPAAPRRGGMPDTSDRRLPISTNDGIGLGRLLVFVVDQSTLEQGEVR